MLYLRGAFASLYYLKRGYYDKNRTAYEARFRNRTFRGY